jgi:hypothetical protein
MTDLLRVLDTIQEATMMRLMLLDQAKGLPQSRWRVLPIGSVDPCAECGERRAGYTVGSGHICVNCAADMCTGYYWPPKFSCSNCGREMTEPSDARTWPGSEWRPTSFTCPNECLETEGEFD